MCRQLWHAEVFFCTGTLLLFCSAATMNRAQSITSAFLYRRRRENDGVPSGCLDPASASLLPHVWLHARGAEGSIHWRPLSAATLCIPTASFYSSFPLCVPHLYCRSCLPKSKLDTSVHSGRRTPMWHPVKTLLLKVERLCRGLDDSNCPPFSFSARL